MSELFAAQLAKRLRDQDPKTTPTLAWLEERLARQGASIDEVVQHAQQRQGASNVTVRNVITSMRLISDIDWAELFESVSLVDERLRAMSAFAAMDFSTRNLYRSAIEQLARGSSSSELDIADHALQAARVAAAATDDAAEAARVGDPGYHLIAEGRRALERTIAFRPSPQLRFSRFNIRLGIGGYVGAILLVTVLLLGAGAVGAADARARRRPACALCAHRVSAGDRRRDRARQSRHHLELRRDDPAGARTDGRRSAIAAHARRRADAADQRGRPAGAGRTSRDPPSRRRRRRSLFRPAVGRRRRGPGDAGGRRRSARRGRRGDRTS